MFAIDRLITLRRQLHQYPQIGFKEFETQKTIKQFLLNLGINQSNIKVAAKTGLIIDLKGKAAPKGKNLVVAFRADIDALSTEQFNHNLPYKSTVKGVGHMCGHDGHTACLLGFIMKFLDSLNEFPSNKTFRMIFQPSQQGPDSGALQIINQGWLKGVDQIYGMHNLPLKGTLAIMTKPGPVQAESTTIKISIIGTSGHGSKPTMVKDALKAGIGFYNKYQAALEQLKNRNFVSTIPVLRCGERYNSFSEECRIEGTIRSFDPDVVGILHQKVKQLLHQIEGQGFKTNLYFKSFAPLNQNTHKEANNIFQAAETFFGAGKCGPGTLPSPSSQDFSYYTKQIPGAFFFLLTGKESNDPFPHTNNYDFNDDFIEVAASFWLQLAKHRANQ